MMFQKPAARVLFSTLFFYALLGVVYGNLHLLSLEGPHIIVATTWKLAAALTALLLLVACVKRVDVWKLIRIDIAVIALAVVLLSDLATRRFGFFSPGTSFVELWYLGGIFTALLVYCAPRLSSHGLSSRGLFRLPMLLLVQLLVAGLFLKLADGRLLFSDDHPSFLYRLHLLNEHFPNIPFYNPQWNGGYSAREFFPSGVLNVYFLSFPLLWWAGDLSVYENAQAYTLIIPYLFIFLVPLSVYLAARVLQASSAAAVVAALLAIGPSTGFFEWLLKYGTLGFSVSIGLLPLCFALAFRLSVDARPATWRDVFFLLLVASLTLMWTLSAFVFLPLIFFCLMRPKATFLKGRGIKIVAFVVLFLLLNGPWILTFLQESNVASFLKADTLPGSSVTHFDGEKRAAAERAEETMRVSSGVETLKVALDRFRELAAKVNPLLIVFAIPGALMFASRGLGITFLLTIFWLLLLAMFGEDLKPQLELRRMILPAAFLMCLPGGVAIAHLFDRFVEVLRESQNLFEKIRNSLGLTVVLGTLVLSVYTVASVYLNRSDEKFVFSTGLSKNLSAAIAKHGGEGRTFFLGFILQELDATWWAAQDGGHIAPLTAFSGKPMYASDFYHTRWSTVDPIPTEYRARGAVGIEEFLDLVNATAVISFKREWAKYCHESERYTEVFKGDRFRLFERRSPGLGSFLSGAGTVKELADGLNVKLDTTEAIIKYRYLPKLRSDDPRVEIEPSFVFTEELGGGKTNDVYFIKLKAQEPGLRIRLSY